MTIIKYLKSEKLQLFLIAFFFILFIFGINFLRVNCVWADDVDILRTLKTTVYATSISEQLGLIFDQHNVHRVPLTRASFLFLQQTIGLRMTHIMYLGDLMYLGIFYLLFKLFREERKGEIVYFLPVTVAMLSLVNVKNAEWAMASIQNIGVQLFVLLTIYLLVKKHSIGRVIFAATLASLTSLTGFITWGLALLYYIFTKEYRKAIIATFAGVVLYICYKAGMEKAIEKDFLGLLLDFPNNLMHLSVFIGQLFLINSPKVAFKGFFIENIILVLSMGTVVIYMLYTFFKIVRNRHIASDMALATILYFIFMMVCGVMSLVVILNNETSFFKRAEIFIPDRYIIHSLIFFNLFYLLFISKKQSKIVLVVGLLLAFAVNIGHAYANVDTFLKRKKFAQVDNFYLENHGVLYSHLDKEGYYINCKTCLNEIFNPLKKKGAKLFPNNRNDFTNVLDYRKTKSLSELKFIDIDHYYYKELVIETKQDVQYFMLSNAEKKYVLPTYNLRNSPRNAIKRIAYFQQTTQGSILLNKIEPGEYVLSMFSEKGDKFVIPTNYHVTIADATTFAKVSIETEN